VLRCVPTAGGCRPSPMCARRGSVALGENFQHEFTERSFRLLKQYSSVRCICGSGKPHSAPRSRINEEFAPRKH